MAFFKKLKDRLFNSSSKIDEGLEAIVSDGGEEEVAVAAQEQTVDAAAEAEARLKEEQAAAQQAAETAAKEVQAAEQARADELAAEQARADELAARDAEIAAQEQNKKQAALDAEQAEAAKLAEQEAESRRVQEAEEAEEMREAAQLAEEEAARAKAAKLAEEAAPDVPVQDPLRTTISPVAPMLDTAPAEETPKRGILGRLMGRGTAAPVARRVLDDAMLEQLEELLITADMGVDTALRVTANMAEGRLGKKLSVQEIKTLMSDEIARIMEPVAKPLPLYAKTPQVVLVVGVNGSGKTTTIGKLASQFRAAGKKVVIAAGDTFRAAAVEQLQVWGERAGVPVLTAPQGSDPASLAFDAMVRAEADGADLLMIDTAGRLQNRGDLMEELAKIVRVIRKKDPDAPHNTLLVLDATTGQNALNQVKVFQEISDVSGLVMTKLDGTAKGGVLVALADKFGLPIHAIGVGEQIDDLSPFDPQEFADALTGLDR